MIDHLLPGPRGKPLLGSLIGFYSYILGFLTRAARDYGDAVHFELGPRKVFLLNHPDLIKDVLVTHHRDFLKSRTLERSKPVLGNGLLTSTIDTVLSGRLPDVVIIATLASRWRMRLAPGYPVKPKPLITPRPEYGMRMTVERR